MPVRQDSVGVGLVSSSTFFPLVPVEQGRDRGVAGLVLLTNGTSGASTTADAQTVNERVNLGGGLTVTLTAAGGIYTGVTVNAAGANYKEGETLLVPFAQGTGGVLRLVVGATTATGAVTGVSIYTNVAAGAVAIGPTSTVPEDPTSGALGLRVTATASGGVVTTLAVTQAGRGYRIGDIVTISVTGAAQPVTARVSALTG